MCPRGHVRADFASLVFVHGDHGLGSVPQRPLEFAGHRRKLNVTYPRHTWHVAAIHAEAVTCYPPVGLIGGDELKQSLAGAQGEGTQVLADHQRR